MYFQSLVRTDSVWLAACSITQGRSVESVPSQLPRRSKLSGAAPLMAADIASRENVKVVMIAGPSSSGKTSFSHRLSIQLMAQGLKPHPISVDNYCVNREDTPRDADGKFMK